VVSPKNKRRKTGSFEWGLTKTTLIEGRLLDSLRGCDWTERPGEKTRALQELYSLIIRCPQQAL